MVAVVHVVVHFTCSSHATWSDNWWRGTSEESQGGENLSREGVYRHKGSSEQPGENAANTVTVFDGEKLNLKHFTALGFK